MTASNILSFFKNGGVYLFDEENAASESTYYKVEDVMSKEEGMNITQTEADEEGILCIFYDCEVLSEEEALGKYANGEYVKSL